jgi:hypothetical protein
MVLSPASQGCSQLAAAAAACALKQFVPNTAAVVRAPAARALQRQLIQCLLLLMILRCLGLQLLKQGQLQVGAVGYFVAAAVVLSQQQADEPPSAGPSRHSVA